MARLILFIGQGFGSGRIPFAPGTFGSVVGLGWVYLLLKTGSPWAFAIGVLLSIPFSAYVCGESEKILGKKDPGSVVLDEIIAIPICFIAPIAMVFLRKDHWPSVDYFFSAPKWQIATIVFVLFRVFDVAKPWPVRQSQNLPGGWGVTIDDVLAAVYVNICFVIYYTMKDPAI